MMGPWATLGLSAESGVVSVDGISYRARRCAYSIGTMFFPEPSALVNVVMYGGLGLSAIVLYDTQKLHYKAEHAAVYSPYESYSLYLDTINIFVRLLTFWACKTGVGGSMSVWCFRNGKCRNDNQCASGGSYRVSHKSFDDVEKRKKKKNENGLH